MGLVKSNDLEEILAELIQNLHSQNNYISRNRGHNDQHLMVVATRGVIFSMRLFGHNFSPTNISPNKPIFTVIYGVPIELICLPDGFGEPYWKICIPEQELHYYGLDYYYNIESYKVYLHVKEIAREEQKRTQVKMIIDQIEQKKEEHSKLLEKADELWDEIEKLEESLPVGHENYLKDDSTGEKRIA